MPEKPPIAETSPQSKGRRALSRRQFLLASAAAVASGGYLLQHRAPRPIEHPNVVVFLADTLRADHLGCYGHGVPTSPNIDAMARESVVFDRCYSQCCWTKPSVASLFTGMPPQVHQAGASEWNIEFVNNAPVQIIRPCFTTIGEHFKRLGYHTAYFLSNAHVQSEFGYGRGFDHYRYVNTWDPVMQVQEAIDWLRKEAQEPFLLFVHEIDPHALYTPSLSLYWRLFGKTPQEALAALSDEDRAQMARSEDPRPIQRGEMWVATDRGFRRDGDPRAEFSAQVKGYMESLYDGEILGVDKQFGRLMRTLEEHGVGDRTAVAFVSDHGESFGEHGSYYHGSSLHNPEVHVPLIIRLPKKMRRPERVPYTVSMLDLYATLVALAGGEVSEQVQSKALIENDGAVAVDGHRECYAAYGQAKQEMREWDYSLIHGPWKAHLTRGGTRFAVYNLDTDPGEDHNLLESRGKPPKAARRFIERFRESREQQFQVAASFGPPEWTQSGANHEEALSALGYL